jgi:ribosomal protein S18 acetylase RimI-like enzyme
MLGEIRNYFNRAKQILQIAGLKALFVRGLKHGFYEHQTYYLYEHVLKDRDEADFVPGVKDFTFKTITCRRDIDQLVSNGFDLRLDITDISLRVDRGAAAYCAFIGRDLASIGFIAGNQEAMNSLNPPPFKVNFSAGEVYTGGLWTNPDYRGHGLAAYIYFKRLQSLKNEGKVIARNIVLKDNTPAHKMLSRFAPKISGEGQASRVLWHIFWKEKSL